MADALWGSGRWRRGWRTAIDGSGACRDICGRAPAEPIRRVHRDDVQTEVWGEIVDLITLLLFIAGLGLLIGGAELLVRGASGLAAAVGITPLVVGLTVVAFGTSSPELAVSVQASAAGQPDIALGNVIGSNIANVLLILGLTAVVAPLAVSRRLVRFDVPVMIGSSVLLLLMALDGSVSRLDGAVLVLGIVSYTVLMIRTRKPADGDMAPGSPAAGPRRWPAQAGLALAGLGLLVLGSRWLVGGAVEIATMLGVSQLVIGLTVVAVGTSLPEIATSVLATLRGERDIAVGNVVGSNLYNILAILGVAGVVSPAGIPVADSALRLDIPIMIGVALVCLPVFFTGYRISRLEGALLLGYYLAYTAFLVLSATGHAALPVFGATALWIVAGTGVVLTLLALRALQPRPAAARARA